MDIKNSVAAQAYARAQATIRNVSSPEEAAQSTPVADFAASFIGSLKENEQTVQAGMVGKADPHSVVEALATTELAVETAVTIRNKVVEAYQEILRMPV